MYKKAVCMFILACLLTRGNQTVQYIAADSDTIEIPVSSAEIIPDEEPAVLDLHSEEDPSNAVEESQPETGYFEGGYDDIDFAASGDLIFEEFVQLRLIHIAKQFAVSEGFDAVVVDGVSYPVTEEDIEAIYGKANDKTFHALFEEWKNSQIDGQ